MCRVGCSPVVERGERDPAQRAPDPVIHARTSEERSMAAVVLDHERAEQEACRNGEEQRAHKRGDQPRCKEAQCRCEPRKRSG